MSIPLARGTMILTGAKFSDLCLPCGASLYNYFRYLPNFEQNYPEAASVATAVRNAYLSTKLSPLHKDLAALQKKHDLKIFTTSVNPASVGYQETKLFGTLEKVKCIQCGLVKKWERQVDLQDVKCGHCQFGNFIPDVVFVNEPIRDFKLAKETAVEAPVYIEIGADPGVSQIVRAFLKKGTRIFTLPLFYSYVESEQR